MALSLGLDALGAARAFLIALRRAESALRLERTTWNHSCSTVGGREVRTSPWTDARFQEQVARMFLTFCKHGISPTRLTLILR